MKLVSLVNSGESLEKVVSLVYCAYESNPDFYHSFEEVIVFYSPNIKKKKNDEKVVGIIDSLYKNKCYKYISKKDIEKQNVLKSLYKKNKITKRQFEKLYENESLFNQIITNMSWNEIFTDFENYVIKKCESRFKNLKIYNINNFYSINELILLLPHYQSFGKVYFYDYNGSMISKKVYKSFNIKSISNLYNNSIYYTFNVYILIILIYNYAKNNSIYIGYRPMKTTPRKTYDAAINYIINNYDKTIVEPRNTSFNKLLSNYSFYLSSNERSYLAIYMIFNKILNDWSKSSN